MPKTVEESLLGDHSDQWIDTDCPEAKRIKVSHTDSLHLYTFKFETINSIHPLSEDLIFPLWFQVEEPSMLSDSEDAVDSRQWTQHHLAAADIRVPPTMALTPPQGEFESDCMDVNVRGPG